MAVLKAKSMHGSQDVSRLFPKEGLSISAHRSLTNALFVWLISHQPIVLFSQNKPATTNQPAVLFSQNKPAPTTNHQPNEQAARQGRSITA
jgi:hypothetical protein